MRLQKHIIRVAKRVVHLGRRAAKLAKWATKHIRVSAGGVSTIVWAKVVVRNVDRCGCALMQTCLDEHNNKEIICFRCSNNNNNLIVYHT